MHSTSAHHGDLPSNFEAELELPTCVLFPPFTSDYAAAVRAFHHQSGRDPQRLCLETSVSLSSRPEERLFRRSTKPSTPNFAHQLVRPARRSSNARQPELASVKSNLGGRPIRRLRWRADPAVLFAVNLLREQLCVPRQVPEKTNSAYFGTQTDRPHAPFCRSTMVDFVNGIGS